MNPLTREWIEKAEADFATASREIRARKSPNYDAVCFHAQQCAEKYLKGLLHKANIRFGKTHNLLALLELLSPVDGSWEILRPQLERLTGFAAHGCYPGEQADKPTATEALKLARTIRSAARTSLGLAP
jgi:HEPN domain-containing protein